MVDLLVATAVSDVQTLDENAFQNRRFWLDLDRQGPRKRRKARQGGRAEARDKRVAVLTSASSRLENVATVLADDKLQTATRPPKANAPTTIIALLSARHTRKGGQTNKLSVAPKGATLVKGVC